MAQWQEISGGITAPRGYRAAGIKAGLKPSGLPDLALILSDVEAIAAGVFTTSQVRAACVDYCRQRLQAKSNARAILCNAGQANAATGSQGWLDALECAMLLGQSLNIPSESVLLASTGVIGQRIRMDAMRNGIPQVVAAASPTGSAIPTPGKTLRKTPSITFPQPPKTNPRVNSLPPSPLSTCTTDANSIRTQTKSPPPKARPRCRARPQALVV